VQYIAFGILGKANGPFTITARRKFMALRSIRQYKNDDIIPAKGKCAPSESLRLKAKGKPPEAPKDILRTRSEEVARVDDGLRELLEDMVTTMRAANGAGLAAVQIGVPRRAVVLENGGEVLKLINPVIIKASGEQLGMESCLSIPGVYGMVMRPERVVVKALDEYGKEMRLEGTASLARALCHEIDHLDGVLFIDKIVPGTRICNNDLSNPG
jgi:peptide deformylase